MESPVQKIRITLLCARSLAKRDLFRLPDPLVRVSVESQSQQQPQVHVTESAKSTVDPKWNAHYDLMIGANDAIVISIWNEKKITNGSSANWGTRGQAPVAAAFLGCVRLLTNAINRLKDTGYQRLDLVPDNNTPLPVKGQVVISLLSRDGHGTGSVNAVVDNLGNLSTSGPSSAEADTQPDTLPAGWELRRAGNGRAYYVNHHTRTTQWNRPCADSFGGLVVSPASPSSSLSVSSPPPLPERNPVRRSGTSGPARPHRSSSRPSSPPLPPGYEPRITTQGQVYFLHTPTGASTWYDPRIPKDLLQVLGETLDSLLGPFPSGWEMRSTTNGRPYYVDHSNRSTQFSDPRLKGSSLQRLIDRYTEVKNRNNGGTTNGATPNGATPNGATLNGATPNGATPNGATSNEATSNCETSNSDATNGASGDDNTGVTAIAVATENGVSNVRATTANNQVVMPPAVVPAAAEPAAQQPTTAATSSSDRVPISSANNAKNELFKKGGEVEVLPKYKRDLVAKIKVLRQELSNLQPPSGHCRLEVSRTDVFEDSYRLIVKMRPKDLRKRLMIKFKDEDGLDYGGIAREWLYLLSHEMLNPYYGLFQYSRDDIYTLQINPDSAVNPDHLSYFHFVGRIIGMAVFHGHYIDGGFTTPFYKMLLNKPITLDDIESVDPTLHKGLTWMLDNNIDGDGDDDSKLFDTTFSVEHEAFGVVKTHELKDGGKNIPVTEANKREYVKLYVNYRWCHGIEQQFLALHKGFHEVVPPNHLRPFDERELELVIGGIGKIDIHDWRCHTRLKHCNTETSVVKWFWEIVEGYSEEMRARLLQFVTGSSRVPLQGFKALQGSTGAAGPRLFTLHVIEANLNNLPKAHTCFNRLDLPRYETKEKMTDKLTQAVEETCGFAVE